MKVIHKALGSRGNCGKFSQPAWGISRRPGRLPQAAVLLTEENGTYRHCLRDCERRKLGWA
ncbi:MAG: hypothetical protein R2861_07080 [Desulfobacterales bacterium]